MPHRVEGLTQAWLLEFDLSSYKVADSSALSSDLHRDPEAYMCHSVTHTYGICFSDVVLTIILGINLSDFKKFETVFNSFGI